MGLKDLTLRTTGTVLLVAAATCYIGFELTRVPESRPAGLERTSIGYSGKFENDNGFTFITNDNGALVNAEELRNRELAEARAKYDSERAGLDKKYNDLQSKLRNFEYQKNNVPPTPKGVDL